MKSVRFIVYSAAWIYVIEMTDPTDKTAIYI